MLFFILSIILHEWACIKATLVTLSPFALLGQTINHLAKSHPFKTMWRVLIIMLSSFFYLVSVLYFRHYNFIQLYRRFSYLQFQKLMCIPDGNKTQTQAKAPRNYALVSRLNKKRNDTRRLPKKTKKLGFPGTPFNPTSFSWE